MALRTASPIWSRSGSRVASRMLSRGVSTIRNSLTALKNRLFDSLARYEAVAKPFGWRFTRRDLGALLDKLEAVRKVA
jgi:hypothetical protein